MPVLLRFNNYIGFFHASLAINRSYYAKQYQRHAVIYAMTERGLPLNGSSQMRDSTGTSLSGNWWQNEQVFNQAVFALFLTMWVYSVYTNNIRTRT